MEISHKGIDFEVECVIGFEYIYATVTTRFTTHGKNFNEKYPDTDRINAHTVRTFTFYCPILDDPDYRDKVLDDDKMVLNLMEEDKYAYEDMIEWVKKDVIAGFYTDILHKDNIHDYKITCNKTLKMWHKNELVATGEDEIETYINNI